MSLNVIDIGKDQAGINLAAVPCDAVIVGVCDAFTNNPCADAQYQAARRAGKRVGVYQFYRNNPNEADYFVSQIRGYIGHAVIIIDAETDGGPGMVAVVLEGGRRILAGTGVRPMLYVPVWLLNKYDWSPAVRAGYALWLPAYVAGDSIIYGFNPPAGLLPPKWWGQCAMWQFTSSGRLPGWGGPLDLSIFAGDGKAWDAFAALTTAQSTTVTPIKEATLSAAEVNQIITAIQADGQKTRDYAAALLVGKYTLPDPITGATVTHPGAALVVEENQRRINAIRDALAKVPAPAVPTAAPVTLTDAQVQQIIAAIPAANLAAIKDQFNK